MPIVLTDLRMPEIDGMGVLKKVKEISPSTMVIVITAFGTVENAVDAMRLGAFDYVLKPFSSEEIDLKIQRALERRRLNDEHRLLVESSSLGAGKLICNSFAMDELMRRLDTVAPLSQPALIVGESGSGKELAAHEIHRRSSRADGPFISINCVALDPFVLDIDVFGAENGALDGVEGRRMGRIELAMGGTIFFNEIAGLGESTQARLEALLGDAVYQRVGGREVIKSDVRVIASTSYDLWKISADGGFRDGLLARFGSCRIAMPPLRERADDIPELAAHFLRRYNEELHKKLTISDEALDILKGCEWPGNAHELENAIAQAVIAARGESIMPEHLPQSIMEPSSALQSRHVAQNGVTGTLSFIEKKLLRDALDREGWNVSRAAQRLGIKRTTLQYKIKKYGVVKG